MFFVVKDNVIKLCLVMHNVIMISAKTFVKDYIFHYLHLHMFFSDF